jgi:alanine dehydrogenase
MAQVLHLASDELAPLADPADHVDVVREAYRQHGEGRAETHPRESLFRSSEPRGLLTGYKAILPEADAMGGYMYGAGFASEDAWFVLPLFSAETGEPLAILDGAAINPLKTGAVGAVGVDALAREDATELAMIGSGAQARGQLRAVAAVRDLEAVRVYSPTREHREAFARAMTEEVGAPVEAVDGPGAALEGADVVVTATTAREPVFDGADLPDGAHVTIMGQYHPERREVDARTIARATYVPDLRERVGRDAGAFIQAREEGAVDDDHVHASLGEVLAGEAPGRTRRDDVTLFDSGGTALETVAAARMLYDRARKEGLGDQVTLTSADEAMPGR